MTTEMTTEIPEESGVSTTPSQEVDENQSTEQTSTFFDLNIRKKHAPASIFDDFGNIKGRSRSFPANQVASLSEKSGNTTLEEEVENWLDSLRIVNGDNVEKGAIPWQIGLRLRQSGGVSDKSICGGSIIRKVFTKKESSDGELIGAVRVSIDLLARVSRPDTKNKKN